MHLLDLILLMIKLDAFAIPSCRKAEAAKSHSVEAELDAQPVKGETCSPSISLCKAWPLLPFAEVRSQAAAPVQLFMKISTIVQVSRGLLQLACSQS